MTKKRRRRDKGPSVAEALITLAEKILYPKGELALTDLSPGTELEQAATALKFNGLPAATKFKAMVERWDLQRIIREVY